MALSERLQLLITANGAQAVSEMNRVGAASTTSLGRAQTSTRSFGQNMVAAGSAVAGFAAVAVVGLGAALRAAEEEELAIQRLNTAFANSPVLVGQSTQALIAQANALQDTTKYADDATIGMQAILATFRLSRSEIEGLTPLVQDLASFWGMDLDSAAKAVGKALQGNIGALQRQGIIIDETAFAADRYSAVMAALRENAGGFAEKEGQSLTGQLAIMRNNLGDFAEEVGRALTPAMSEFVGALQEATPLLEQASPLLEGMATNAGDLASATSGVVGFFDAVVSGASDIIGDEEWLSNALKDAFENLNPIGASKNVFGAITGGFESLDSVLDENLGNALEGAVLRSHALVAAQADIVIAASAAAAGMGDLGEATDETSGAVERLGDEWNGLSNNLSQFDATTAAADALYGFRDAVREATRNGRIGGREMIDLRQAMSRLVGTTQRSAEATATAADGTVNYAARNRALRRDLGGLAAFIPAQLRPQFTGLTEDVLAVPDNANINVTSNVSSTLTAFQQLPAAIRAAATAADSAMANRAAALQDMDRSVGGGKGPTPRSVYRGTAGRVAPVMVVR